MGKGERKKQLRTVVVTSVVAAVEVSVASKDKWSEMLINS
jgi:hypothetical protein